MNTTVEQTTREARSGVAYGLAAYLVWGFFPLYFKALAGVTSLEILAHRIFWSVLSLIILLTVLRRWQGVRQAFAAPRILLTLSTTSLLIAINWLVFIYAVGAGKVLESSLGYFINPLVSAFLGVLFLGEKLSRTQRASFLLAATGVLLLTIQHGEFPWIALTLAFSFGLYGLLRKQAPVDALAGLTVETLLLFPLVAVYLGWLVYAGRSAFVAGPSHLTILLSFSGIITSTPLIWFAAATKRLRLVTVGLMQYLVPTFHLILAVFVFGETFTTAHLLSFILIWAGLILYTVDSVKSLFSGRISTALT
ncbi:MAG: EamA family transporter RarD [Deltaproteobacteria bacterium HGW-Deltaproteobacteria-4]|nr:MAG: EamA family transporter RarD [Deltaproteobacteria bacterium HGW-Deltaproteobacteria-4]